MKYEAKVDLRNANTSHALIVELVGCDKKVLDVGCASGYLGEILKQRGCTVIGIESDLEAAEAAKAVLDEVVVGDVGELDLVGRFGPGSFDVVVFGDVLEHVADPVAILRRLRPLLVRSGSVVASIPNVAHGAVRLSLMSGRFEYRPLGLLDETHLRFFTRASLYDLFRQAGLVPIDVRRTTAGVFETEIAVRREDFDDDVVEAVEGDPDATTYQFVLEAVLEDGVPEAASRRPPALGPASPCRIGIWAARWPDDLRDALVVRVTRAELARRLPDAEIRLFAPDRFLGQTPHTGGEPVEPLGELSPDRLDELADQLDCLVVTGDVPDDGATAEGDTAPFLVDGLGRGRGADCPAVWSAVRMTAEAAGDVARSAADRLDATVIDDTAAHPPFGLGADVAAVPDPLLFTSRVLRPEPLRRRLEYLRVMGWFPDDGPAIVVEVAAGMQRHVVALAAALDAAIAARPGSSVVLIELEPGDAQVRQAGDMLAAALQRRPFRLPSDALADDVVAAVANAAALAASSPSGVSLARSYGLPHTVVDLVGGSSPPGRAIVGEGLGPVSPPEDLGGLFADRFRVPDAGALQARLDLHFDRVAAIADGAAAARPRLPAAGPFLPRAEYVAALESAYARMRLRVDAERRVIADHLVNQRDRHDSELRRVGDALDRLDEAKRALSDALSDERERVVGLQAQLDDVTSRLADRESEFRRVRAIEDRLSVELEALKNTRTLRMVRPVRVFYARLRGRRV